MFNIIKTHEELSYKGLWTAFRTTEMREDGKVWDMYSCTTNYRFGTDQAGSYKRKEMLTIVNILFLKVGLVKQHLCTPTLFILYQQMEK